ncbi:hypothetical protein HDU80_003237 [Chytriomyces hyalinus]|nr:hypothetical protein HDU80_003237 [Chytriomyces hyalinus]
MKPVLLFAFLLPQLVHGNRIVFAFVGPYRAFPSLDFDGSMVNDRWLDRVGNGSTDATLKAFLANDRAAEAAVDFINSDVDGFFQNTSVEIRRFDERGNSEARYGNGGYALAETALQIAENNPDVMAVFGGVSSEVTKYTAQLFSHFQIPYCGPMQGSPSLSDKNKYPYFIRPAQGLGAEKHFYQILSFWNVSRVAIITDRSDYLANTFSASTSAYLESKNIKIISRINVESEDQETESDGLFRYVASSLERVDARYIILCGGPEFLTLIYGRLYNMNSSVGPDYVWLSYNSPSKTEQPINFQNFVQLVASNAISNYSSQLLDSIESRTRYHGEGGGLVRSGPLFNDTGSMEDTDAWGNADSGEEGTVMVLGDEPSFDDPLPSSEPPELDPGFIVLGLNVTKRRRFMSRRDSPETPTFRFSNQGAAYDCIMLLAHGLTNLSHAMSPDATERSISKLANHSIFSNTGYRGINGDPLALTDAGDLFAGYVARTWMNSQNQNLSWLNFGTTDPEATSFALLQNTSFRFAGDRINPPQDGRLIITEKSLNVSDAVWYTLIIAAILGSALSLSLADFLFVFRRSKPVKQSSPSFLSIVCLGCLPIYLNLITYTLRLDPLICTLQFCLPLSGYICTIGPLLIKNWRAYVVVNSRQKLRGIWFQDVFLLPVCGGVIAFEVCLLVGWWHLHQPKLDSYFLDKTTYMPICKTNQSPAIDAVLWVFNALLFLASVVLLVTAGRNPTHHLDLDTLQLTAAFALIIAVVLIPAISFNAPTFAASGVIPLIYAAMATLVLISLVGKNISAVRHERLTRLTSLSKGEKTRQGSDGGKSFSNQSTTKAVGSKAQVSEASTPAVVSIAKTGAFGQLVPYVTIGLIIFAVESRFGLSEWMLGSAVMHPVRGSVILLLTNVDTEEVFAINTSDKTIKQVYDPSCPSRFTITNSATSICFEFQTQELCTEFWMRLKDTCDNTSMCL